MPNKFKIRKGDNVIVTAGKDSGKTGEVLLVYPNISRILVRGVNVVKRHTKPNAQNPQGGIIEKEAPIAISNLSLLTAEGQTTRIGYRMEDGKKVRVSRKTNEAI